MLTESSNELWIWTELLAFDNTLPDFGVKTYLAQLGKIPTGISILTGLDFVMLHESLTEEKILPAGVCSRGAHSTNGKRDRQEWTNYQVRDLVRELHKYGIKVIYNVFKHYMDDVFNREFLTENSPEKRLGLIAPMNDGRIMGDFLIEKLPETLVEYDFDGWHAADGIAAPWNSIMYPMDNFIRMFAEEKKHLGLPAFLMKNADQDDPERRRKLKYLQQFCWREWNDYMQECWTAFWKKLIRTVHGLGKFVMANSPNTKSIFGALQYMNVDYRYLAKLGLDYLVVETCTTSSEIIWHNRPLLHEFSAMASEMTASMPQVKILLMPAVRDRFEGFDVFEHALPRFERDLHILNGLSIVRNGRLQRCADGFVFCLGDCIEPREWELFHELYRQSVNFPATRCGEMVWLLDPGVFDALREDHHRFGTWSPSMQIARLKDQRSIDISTVAGLEELPHISQPLIVPDFHLLPEASRKRILESGLPLVVTGNCPESAIPEEAETISWRLDPDFNWCCIFLNWPGQSRRRTEVLAERPLEPFDESKAFGLYRELYPHLDIPDRFWEIAADRIRELLGPLPMENEADGAQLFRQYAEDGSTRIMQISMRDHYILSEYRIGDDDPEITVAGRWPKMPLCCKDQMLAHNDVLRPFPVKIPPRGIIVVDVKSKNEPEGSFGKGKK